MQLGLWYLQLILLIRTALFCVVIIFLFSIPEDGTDRLSGNIGKNIPLNVIFTGPCIVIYSYSTTNKMHMELKPTDVTISILFIYCRICTCFGPTGPSSGEFTQLLTQPLVQYLYCSGRVLCMSSTDTEPMVVWTAVWTLLRMGLWARNM